MASAAFPEPVKGEANPGVVLGTPAGEECGPNVTGVALTTNSKSQGGCKRRCCIGAGITVALLATLGIGILVGFLVFNSGHGEHDALETAGREAYAPEMGGFLTLSVANVSQFLAHPQVRTALSTGIASLHDEVHYDDVVINDLLRVEELDDMRRRLQEDEQHVHVLYTVRRSTVEQAAAVLEALQRLPQETVADKLRTAAQSFGLARIDAVEEPRFCMVLERRRDEGRQNLRGQGGREGPEGRDRDRRGNDRREGEGRDRDVRERRERRGPGDDGWDDEDDDDRRLQPRDSEDAGAVGEMCKEGYAGPACSRCAEGFRRSDSDPLKCRPLMEACDWAARPGREEHRGQGHRRDENRRGRDGRDEDEEEEDEGEDEEDEEDDD